MKNEIISIIKKTKYKGVSVDIPGMNSVVRDVIVFDNRTDKEIDIYVKASGKYSNYYYKIMSFNKTNRKTWDPKRLPEAVHRLLWIESNKDLEAKMASSGLLCEAHLID